MFRKRLGVAVSLGLLVILILTFLTGFIAAALDLNRFAYHKYAAYAAIALAAVHVVLHWRVLVGQVRRWVLGMQTTSAPRVSASSSPARSLAHSPAREPSPAPPHLRSRIAHSPARPVARSQSPRLTRRGFLWPGLPMAAGTGMAGWWVSQQAQPTLAAGEDLGQVYHQWSTPSYVGLLTKSLHVRPQPSLYKAYPGAPVVTLPPLAAPAGPPLEEVIARRRSVREYGPRPVSLQELSSLLGYSAGITDTRDPSYPFRAVPSSGALYPVEVYPVLFNVASAEPGVYHYDVQHHRLELLRPGDFRRDVFEAAVSQEMVLHAALVLVLTGLFSRVHFKYVDRSYRYLMLEAGHLGQNVYLTATALGLGPCGIGAFFDDQLQRLLGVDGQDEVVSYLMAVGPLRG